MRKSLRKSNSRKIRKSIYRKRKSNSRKIRKSIYRKRKSYPRVKKGGSNDNKCSQTISEEAIIIVDNAFSQCTALTTINLPNTLTSIRERAFEWCPLKTITIPDNLTSIERKTFSHCEHLTFQIM